MARNFDGFCSHTLSHWLCIKLIHSVLHSVFVLLLLFFCFFFFVLGGGGGGGREKLWWFL